MTGKNKMEELLYLQITSGRGPVECCRIVVLVVKELIDDATRSGVNAEVCCYNDGPSQGTWSSATVKLSGPEVDAFAEKWCGSIQWVAQSIYRPNHGRKNWFVGVSWIELPALTGMEDADEIEYETLRASGPGGQHVNKTESAVRATHIPTGISVLASDRRSQQQNKKLARERLLMKVAMLRQSNCEKRDYNNWNNHNMVQRGNPIKVFKKSMR